jgi:hypothetical protein
MSITGNGVRVKCVKSLPRGQPETVADVPQSLRTHVEPGARLLVVRVLITDVASDEHETRSAEAPESMCTASPPRLAFSARDNPVAIDVEGP